MLFIHNSALTQVKAKTIHKANVVKLLCSEIKLVVTDAITLASLHYVLHSIGHLFMVVFSLPCFYEGMFLLVLK